MKAMVLSTLSKRCCGCWRPRTVNSRPLFATRNRTGLAVLTGRAQPNLTRTLGKLAVIGFVRLQNIDRRKVPTTTIHSLRINIDPFSQNDRLELA